MKRSDRLLSIITLLRQSGPHLAEDIAAKLGVTVRTIYRDMDTLRQSGVPVVGERGTGYHITAPVTLPPLNLTMTELEALHIGLMAVAQSGEDDLQDAAQSLADKLDAVLSEDVQTSVQGLALRPYAETGRALRHLPALRQSIRARQKVDITLGDRQFTLRPLSVDYWGRVWTCAGWNETDRSFAEFRVDQIDALRKLPSLFVQEAGKTLDDFKRQRETRNTGRGGS